MDPTPLWPLAVYFVAVLVLLAVILGLSHVLGQRHSEPMTGQPYESGSTPVGPAWMRLTPGFYLVAMLFLIFDLEAVFLFAWAVAMWPLGWAGFAEAAVFIGLLLVALVYVVKVGALDWGTRWGAEAPETGVPRALETTREEEEHALVHQPT